MSSSFNTIYNETKQELQELQDQLDKCLNTISNYEGVLARYSSLMKEGIHIPSEDIDIIISAIEDENQEAYFLHLRMDPLKDMIFFMEMD